MVTIFIAKISKEHNSVKMQVEVRFFSSTHCLMVVHISTKFHENILNGIRVIKRTQRVNGWTDGGHDIIRPVFDGRIKSKMIGNDEELIQSDSTSHP